MAKERGFTWPPLVKDLLYDVLGSICLAIGITTFIKHAGFAPGGVSGISLLINHFVPALPIGTLNLVLNVPLLLFSLRLLGRRFIVRTLRTLVVSAVFIDLVLPQFSYYHGEPMLACLFAGFFTGLGLSIVFSNASCTGGVDLIIMCTKKLKPHFSIGQITIVVDTIIIVSGGLVFGKLDAILYGVLFTFVQSTVLDKMMYGFTSGKMALIITDDGSHIARGIDRHISRGSTILQGKGYYSGQDKQIVLCALRRQQLPALQRMVRDVDPASLVIVLEYNEVYGTGFQSLLDKHGPPTKKSVDKA